MVDVLEPEGELAAAKFNEDFGPDKVEFISCDITRSSEFDGTSFHSNATFRNYDY